MMTRFLLFSLFLFLGTQFVSAQCAEDEETKVLLIGDSWAFFMGFDNTIDDVFEDWGHSNYKFYTNTTLAENGAETEDFLESTRQGEIANQLISQPSIEYVHLSIGGNDVLGSWKSQSFTTAQTDSLRLQVRDSVIAVIDFLKSVRPNIKIVWSGYAYSNFEEVITGAVIPSAHPFNSNWQNMESPSNSAINEQLNLFSETIEDYYMNDPRVFFVKSTAITQHTYGQIDPLGVAPFGVYPARTVPLPYGNVDYPSPRPSMRNYGVFKDCFHLSQQGYEDLIGYTTQKYYHKALMDDKYFIAENALTNGSVASNGIANSQILLGVDNGVEHQAMLTFETLYELDSVAEKASLFLHRKTSTGANPVTSDIVIEINNLAFGTSTAVEAADFNANGMESGVPCVFGTNTDGNWVRFDLPEELLSYMTINNVTQFKIKSPNATNGVVEFSGVGDPDFAPILNVTYGDEQLVSLPTEELKDDIIVYPNPANDHIHISSKNSEVERVIIYSIEGRVMRTSKASELAIDELPSGAYFVHVHTSKGVSVQKLIKK
ncbi:hypothetical protein CW751_09160 [Brumimicrobium salinarum]|uniref:Secretion system C-terminal sorting domain-containing protein n=1 Tax=Brumimicrobium salinarum TaxID=2058658 RepID=A0A2I0R1S7_9FLAO|nr:SGNH/GDSL hydrolase family protein [Brumimicrobium salinarum]PKR80533.1 hypothetical protein CW751_09160 [Brumimicrobium salinarum]